MYGFEFNIAGNAAKAMQEMFANTNNVTKAAQQMQKQFDGIKFPPIGTPTKNPFRDIMPSVTQTQSVGKTAQNPTAQSQTGNITDTIKDIKTQAENAQSPFKGWLRNVVHVKNASENIKEGIGGMIPILDTIGESWGGVQTSIIEARKALSDGNMDLFKEIATDTIENVKGIFEQFREPLGYIKTAFGDIVNMPMLKNIKEGALGALTNIKSMSLGLGNATIEALKFAGRGVVSMAGYALSLFGATGAQTALNVAMAANPIGLVVAGIAGVGVAVYGLITYWDTVKSYLMDFGAFLWKYSPFGFIYDIVDRLFPNLTQSVQNTFGGIMKWLNDYFLQPIKDMFGWVMDKAKWLIGEVSKPFTIDINATMPTITKMPQIGIEGIDIGESPMQETLKKMSKATKGAKSIFPKAPKHERIGVDKKTKEITGEQKQVKNITITINSLISGGFTVVSNNLQESEQKIKDVITRVLVDATNQVNYQ
jgi:hypothetical protein